MLLAKQQRIGCGSGFRVQHRELTLRPVRTAPARPTRLASAQVEATTATAAAEPRVAEVQAVQPSSPAIISLQNPQEFETLLKESPGHLVLVDYYTDWCGPCKLMEKELVKLTAAFPKGVKFAKFNCGDHQEFSTSQRIRSLPTFRLYKGGRCLDQITGAKPVQLRQMLVHYFRPF